MFVCLLANNDNISTYPTGFCVVLVTLWINVVTDQVDLCCEGYHGRQLLCIRWESGSAHEKWRPLPQSVLLDFRTSTIFSWLIFLLLLLNYSFKLRFRF